MERAEHLQKRSEEKPLHHIELPVKIDMINGADGLELYEIVFALQYTAEELRSSDPFRAMYLDRLVVKYQSLQQARLSQIKRYFEQRFVLEQEGQPQSGSDQDAPES